jgi:hypothetical protein
VIDDTAVPKKGQHSVGVASQYASALGKNANCQTLVSLTLARGEVPVMVALRLFLPESWTSDPARLKRAGVPVEYRTARSKPEIALAEIDRVTAADVRFGCVLADGVTKCLEFARPMMRRGAGFNTYKARWQLLKKGQDVASLQLAPNDHLPISVNAVDLKDRLRDIETDCRDRSHG